MAGPAENLSDDIVARALNRAGEKINAEVVAHLEAKRVARFKFPERLEVVERFPLTAVGKVSKKDLRESIRRKLEEEGKLG